MSLNQPADITFQQCLSPTDVIHRHCAMQYCVRPISEQAAGLADRLREVGLMLMMCNDGICTKYHLFFEGFGHVAESKTVCDCGEPF